MSNAHSLFRTKRKKKREKQNICLTIFQIFILIETQIGITDTYRKITLLSVIDGVHL